MLKLLPPKRAIDAAPLRDKLEEDGFSVNLRTVQRDLKELMEIFPITAREGKPISWRWDQYAKAFSIPGMDKAAALTLKMVSEFMVRLLPKNCLDSLAPHLRSADAILAESSYKGFASWPDKVKVISRTQPLLPPDVNSAILDNIYEALFHDHQFKATYLKKGTTEPVEYLVNPLGLVAADPVLYLVATLWNYDDIKLLPIHRFQSVEITDNQSRRPEAFSLDNYLESGALGFPVSTEKKIRIQILFDNVAVLHLRESPLSLDQVILEQNDGRVLVEANVLDTQQLRWWLLSFGAHIEVVGPETLRKEFTATVRNMANRYSS